MSKLGRIRTDRWRLRVRRAVLADLHRRWPGDQAAYLAAEQAVAEVVQALPWWARIGIR